MMCAYSEIEYESAEYVVKGEPGSYDLSSWFSKKAGLLEKNPLMNLPYVYDGDNLVTQSNACLYYLGRKFNLNGSNEVEIQRNDQVLCEVMDLRNNAVKLFYLPHADFDSSKHSYIENTASKHLNKLEAWLQLNKTKFMAADEPRTCDFPVWEMLDQHEKFAHFVGVPSPLESRPHLKAYYEKFSALPTLLSYFSGPQYSLPVNNVMSSFR